MYKIPVSNYPNQTFVTTVPVNGQNKSFKFHLWYNYKSEYWLLTLSDVETETVIFENLPLVSSNGQFYNILSQLQHLCIGMCIMLPVVDDKKSQANDKNLGTSYVMIWGDNDVIS